MLHRPVELARVTGQLPYLDDCWEHGFHGYSANGFNQLDRSDIQSVGQLHDVDEAHVPLPAFHSSHVVPMQIS